MRKKCVMFLGIWAVSLLNAAASYDVLGIGSPIADMIIPVSNEFMATVPGERGGSQEVDLKNLKYILHNSGVEPKCAPGGSASNTLKGLSNLGTKAAFLGKVGQDPVGNRLVQNLRNSGVISLLLPSKAETGQLISLLTPDGERTFRIYAGSSLELGPADLKPSYFEGVKLVHIEGYALRNPGLVPKAVEMAKNSGAKVSFDMGCHELAGHNRELIMEMIRKHIDIVFANEDEIRALTGLGPHAACEYLKDFCEIVVVCIGKEGCLVGKGDRVILCPTTSTKVVDTTGAGDLFASGFLHGYLEGYRVEDCARLGNLLGGKVITVYGAEISQEKWTEIREKIAEMPINKIELLKIEKVH